MLTATGLAEDGVVEIDGERPGSVYLVDGGVSYAETPHAPGIGERLVAAGRLTADEWTSLREIGGSGPRFAELLAGYGIERHELTSLTESVVVDSILALLTAAGSARFVPGRRHWMDVGIRLDGAAVRDVLALRAPGTVAATIDADSVVCLAEPDRRWQILTAEQWQVLCRLPDRARIRDLALAEALGVYEVVDRVAALVEAGLCTVVPADPAPERAPAPAAWEEPATVPELVAWSGPAEVDRPGGVAGHDARPAVGGDADEVGDAGWVAQQYEPTAVDHGLPDGGWPGEPESAPHGSTETVAGLRVDWPAEVAERGLVDHGPAGPTDPAAGWWRAGMYDYGIEQVRTAEPARAEQPHGHLYDTAAHGSSAWAAEPWTGRRGERPDEDGDRWSGHDPAGQHRTDGTPATAVDAGIDAPAHAPQPAEPHPPRDGAEPAGRDEAASEPLPRRRPGQTLSPATVFRLRDAARGDDEADRGPDTQTLRLLLGSLQRLEER